MEVSAFATNLEPDQNGILLTHSISAVSYPDEGNQRYREIEDGSYWFEHRNRCIVAVKK